MIIAIGTDPETFGLDEDTHFRLLTLFWLLLHIYTVLWHAEWLTSTVLGVVHKKIQIMMKLFRKLFQEISKVACRNLKFHLCLHLIAALRKMASTRLTYTGPGEQRNKGIKRAFARTSKKRRNVNAEIFKRGEETREVNKQMRDAGGHHC